MSEIKYIRILSMVGGLMALSAQAVTYREVLQEVVSNSPEMAVAGAVADAERDENHTGLTLANPEAAFSYQWELNHTGDKKTFDLSQEFDMATLSGAKRHVATARDRVAEATYDVTRRDVAARADALMTEIVWRRKMQNYYASECDTYGRMLQYYEEAMKRGIYNIVDYNSIRMQMSAVETEAKINTIELTSLLKRMERLAGGKLPAWDSAEYADFTIPAPTEYQEWQDQHLRNNPEYSAAQAAGMVAEREVTLRKRENLPSISLGYTGEVVADENFHGVSVGLELPLWGNRGKVKAARAAEAAAKLEAQNVADEYRSSCDRLYLKAVALGDLEQESRKLRDECDSRESLKKLYDLGQLSVHDYLSQLLPLFELDRKVLDTEYEYQQALCDLRNGAF